MIGQLRGRLLEKQPPTLLVDVAGVGYELEAPMSVFYELPAIGGEVTLRTHLVVRDDAHVLYGFATAHERQVFRGLIRVSGVGPKLALAVLSGMRPAEIMRAIEMQDTATLTRLPGIGRKIAERVVMEMRDRVSELSHSAPPAIHAGPATSSPEPVAEAVSALMALGYKPVEANRLVEGLAAEAQTSEAIIREALRKAVR